MRRAGFIETEGNYLAKQEIQAAETGSQEHLNGSGHDMQRALAIGSELVERGQVVKSEETPAKSSNLMKSAARSREESSLASRLPTDHSRKRSDEKKVEVERESRRKWEGKKVDSQRLVCVWIGKVGREEIFTGFA